MTASAVFGPAVSAGSPAVSQPMPEAPPPLDCELYRIPADFVPISSQIEIRPVGTARPFAGGPQPELTAWIRLVSDDCPPTPSRLLFLMDSLAPSYAAIFTSLALIPTVELSVSLRDELAAAVSPWVLVRATTRSAESSGWTTEDLDCWSPAGAHLGSARRLRFAR